MSKNPVASIEEVAIQHGPNLPFLEDLVLVDTPGLGNTEAEHELTERFLHLCHLIVITVDSAVPFAASKEDFSLLDQAFNRLSGVPKIFAITKSANLLQDHALDIDKDWDQAEADEFWLETVDRVVKDSQLGHLKSLLIDTPRVFVDAHRNFNIEEFKNRIRSTVEDPLQKERVFSAQERYVRNVSRSYLETFVAHLETRISNIKSIRAEAERKARDTENTISSQIASVRNANQTVNAKLNQHIQERKNEMALLSYPPFDEEAIGERYQGFTRRMSALEQKAATCSRVLTEQCKDEAMGACNRIVSLWDPEAPLPDIHLDERLVLSDCWQHDEIAALNDDLFTYQTRGLRKLERQIRYATEYDDAAAPGAIVAESISITAGGLGQFIKLYNQSAHQFYAYLMLPSSQDALAEYGLILFDQGYPADEGDISADEFPTWKEIKERADSCKEELDKIEPRTGELILERELVDRLDRADEGISIVEVFDQRFREVKSAELRNTLNTQVAKTLSDTKSSYLKERKDLIDLIQRLWAERLDFAFKAALILFFFFGISVLIRLLNGQLYILLVYEKTEYLVALVAAAILGTLKYLWPDPGTRETRFEFGSVYKFRRTRKELLENARKSVVASLNSSAQRANSKQMDMPKVLSQRVSDWFERHPSFNSIKAIRKSILSNRNARQTIVSGFHQFMNSAQAKLLSEVEHEANNKRQESIEKLLSSFVDKERDVESLRRSIEQCLQKI